MSRRGRLLYEKGRRQAAVKDAALVFARKYVKPGLYIIIR